MYLLFGLLPQLILLRQKRKLQTLIARRISLYQWDHNSKNCTGERSISMAENKVQKADQEIVPLSSESLKDWDDDSPPSEVRCFFDLLPKRFIFSFVGFLSSSLAISLNTNLSLAIVSMVDRTNASFGRTSNECLSTSDRENHEAIERHSIGEFRWSPEIEGLALGAVYYGQLVGFFPSGRLAELWGGKKTLLAFTLVASIFTGLTPLAARYLPIYAFIACRFLVGVGTAPVIPALYYMISRWIPESERSFSASFVLAGYGVGAFLSFFSAGHLCATKAGWPSVFYVGAGTGLAWCLICQLLVYETPSIHPSISKKELRHIEKGIQPTKQIERIPWKNMCTSLPLWALSIGYFGQFWILGFYSTTQALYMGTVLKLDSIKNGEMSCLPPLTRALFACLCAYPADYAVRSGWVQVGFIRKGATLANSLFSCAGFLAVVLAGCDPLLNTIFFTVGGLLGDFVTFGVCMAGVDIAPNLSGTVSGILSIVGVIPFFVIPALVGWSTKHERTMMQWRYIYYSSIVVVMLTTLIYLFFGTSEPQIWGTRDLNKSESSSKESRIRLSE